MYVEGVLDAECYYQRDSLRSAQGVREEQISATAAFTYAFHHVVNYRLTPHCLAIRVMVAKGSGGDAFRLPVRCLLLGTLYH